LGDLAYVAKEQAGTTARPPFGDWYKAIPDPAMTQAVVDRRVHHSTIFERDVESYGRRIAMERSQGPG